MGAQNHSKGEEAPCDGVQFRKSYVVADGGQLSGTTRLQEQQRNKMNPNPIRSDPNQICSRHFVCPCRSNTRIDGTQSVACVESGKMRSSQRAIASPPCCYLCALCWPAVAPAVRRNELRCYRRASLVSQQLATPEAAAEINPPSFHVFPNQLGAFPHSTWNILL